MNDPVFVGKPERKIPEILSVDEMITLISILSKQDIKLWSRFI
jgi:hypothetical protein